MHDPPRGECDGTEQQRGADGAEDCGPAGWSRTALRRCRTPERDRERRDVGETVGGDSLQRLEQRRFDGDRHR